MSRETELSELVAKAHLCRAKDRAKHFAARFQRPVFVYATRHGLKVDTTAPMVAQAFWMATPDGAVCEVRAKT